VVLQQRLRVLMSLLNAVDGSQRRPEQKTSTKTEAVSETPSHQPMRHAMDLQIKMEFLSAG